MSENHAHDKINQHYNELFRTVPYLTSSDMMGSTFEHSDSQPTTRTGLENVVYIMYNSMCNVQSYRRI
jgi:hypothetical protein